MLLLNVKLIDCSMMLAQFVARQGTMCYLQVTGSTREGFKSPSRVHNNELKFNVYRASQRSSSNGSASKLRAFASLKPLLDGMQFPQFG